jgi:hypothetical protein
MLNLSHMCTNLICRSHIAKYNTKKFKKVVNAARKGKNELLAVINSGISINVQNEVNHKKLN